MKYISNCVIIKLSFNTLLLANVVEASISSEGGVTGVPLLEVPGY